MDRLLTELDWLFDYYVIPFLYNRNEQHSYFDYMMDKWEDRFTSKLD